MQLTRVEIEGKRWYKGPDGKLYPSAGSVLDILFPFNKDFIKEVDLARGTLCHELTAQSLLAGVSGNESWFDDWCKAALLEGVHTEDDIGRAMARVSKVVEYLNQFTIETISIESPILFLGVGMTPDYTCKEMNTTNTWRKRLFDWKYAESIDESYYYQAELYGRAEKADLATILQCNRKGEVFPHNVDASPERWELIKSAINVRHHQTKKEIRRYV